jgi:phosphoglycolate phosphatase
MKKLILFDLDGTVLDTEEDLLICANELFARLGYPTVDRATVKRANGKDAYGYMRTLLGDAVSDEEIARIWVDYVQLIAVKGADKTHVFAGLTEVLSALCEKGYTLAVLTNKAESEMPIFKEKILKHLPFDRILAVGGTTDAKPSPRAIEKCLQHYGVDRKNAFLVGDGEPDILTALAAEITPIAVLWGNRTREQLAAVGATVFAAAPSELLPLIG